MCLFSICQFPNFCRFLSNFCRFFFSFCLSVTESLTYLPAFTPILQTTATLPNSYQLIIIGEWMAIGASHQKIISSNICPYLLDFYYLSYLCIGSIRKKGVELYHEIILRQICKYFLKELILFYSILNWSGGWLHNYMIILLFLLFISVQSFTSAYEYL